MSTVQENPLALQIKDAQVSESDSLILQNAFGPLFKQAEEWRYTAEAIVVTSVEDKAMMKKAREARLALKEIRVNAEKIRKELKEDSLRKGKAIDGMANVIKYLIVPLEEHLEKQENFALALEEQRLKERTATRQQELSSFVADISVYDLASMSDETFSELLETSKTAFEASKEAAAKAELERIAKEKAEADERERMRIENERLKKEAQERDIALAAERKERERIEVEARLKKDREEAAKREAEEKKRQESLAPDKEKLVALAARIAAVPMPEVSSTEARAVIEHAIDLLSKASQYVKTQSISL